jgi:hypothetical protein
MKKSGFADWNTTTFTDGSASRSVISAANSTIVAGTNMSIGGLLEVTRKGKHLIEAGLEARRPEAAGFQ